MDSKEAALLDRIRHLQEAIARAREYLESGKNAHWHGFRPLFSEKVRDGKSLPPHRDWVARVFLPRRERALERAEAALAKLRDR